MSTRWCPYCGQDTPKRANVVIEICTDLACINTGHHAHRASRVEHVCATCDMPFHITDHPTETRNG